MAFYGHLITPIKIFKWFNDLWSSSFHLLQKHAVKLFLVLRFKGHIENVSSGAVNTLEAKLLSYSYDYFFIHSRILTIEKKGDTIFFNSKS